MPSTLVVNHFIRFRRHVLKFTVACPLASHLQIMSDTNDFTFGDEDQLLSKIVSVPVSLTMQILLMERIFLLLIGRC